MPNLMMATNSEHSAAVGVSVPGLLVHVKSTLGHDGADPAGDLATGDVSEMMHRGVENTTCPDGRSCMCTGSGRTAGGPSARSSESRCPRRRRSPACWPRRHCAGEEDGERRENDVKNKRVELGYLVLLDAHGEGDAELLDQHGAGACEWGGAARVRAQPTEWNIITRSCILSLSSQNSKSYSSAAECPRFSPSLICCG